MKTIVVSAVNLIEGGTLTILRDCLSYLSQYAQENKVRVVAIVFDKKLAYYPHIEYIEDKWPKKRWINRIWFEYVSLKKIARELGPIELWFSLHDTSPNVFANRRAVYCHNPFPFYQWKWQEALFAPKIVLFSLFSTWIYKTNIHKNNLVIVQQQWIKNAFKQRYNLPANKIVVALPDPPMAEEIPPMPAKTASTVYQFIYAASPNSHKNFECLCQAARLLEDEGITNFKVIITINGTENSYAKWLYKKWGEDLKSIEYIGFQSRASIFTYYASSDCLIFPSKVETWGLPITEFKAFEKPMLLANLPYAYETAAGSTQVGLFHPNKPAELARLMKKLISGEREFLRTLPPIKKEEPTSNSWGELFHILLNQ